MMSAMPKYICSWENIKLYGSHSGEVEDASVVVDVKAEVQVSFTAVSAIEVT